MQIMTLIAKKRRWQLLCMFVGLAPIQASLAVTSSSVSTAHTVNAKPAPAKPVVVAVKAAPAKSHTASVAPKQLAMAKPLAASTKASAKPNINAAPQNSAPGANVSSSTPVSQNKPAEP